MAFDYQRLDRNPVDPRVIERIQRSPRMVYEQGSSFMGGWGGPTQYRTLAGLPVNQRKCYAAVLDGKTTTDQISIVTGLDSTEVDACLATLETKGLVELE